MAALLDLFSPALPDTPFLDIEGDADDEDETEPRDRVEAEELHTEPEPAAVEEAQEDDVAEAPTADAEPEWREPYPVILGPIAEDEPAEDAFAEVDLSALHTDPSGSAPAEVETEDTTGPAPEPFPIDELADHEQGTSELVSGAPDASDDTAASPLPEPPAIPVENAGLAAGGDERAGSARQTEARPRPVVRGDTPLLTAARVTVAYHVAAFEEAAARFVASRKPSDARRLLVALHRLRLAVETFAPALPVWASGRLVAVLRPLAEDLEAALDAGRSALLDSPARNVLARRAAAGLAAAADRLQSSRQRDWGARAGRLLDLLDAQQAAGLLRPDDAAPADDFVGQPGDAPTATRLRHVAGSALWSRFEAIRAAEDDLDRPTSDLAAHLAVAVSALRFTLGLVGEEADGAHEVAAALGAAEQALAEARQRAVAARLGAVDPSDAEADLDVVAHVWRELTDRPFRAELAAVLVTI